MLEEFVARGKEVIRLPRQPQRISDLIGSLRELSEAPWKDLLEPLIVFERVLATDPAKAYVRMDFQSRELYRHTVAHFAENSDCPSWRLQNSPWTYRNVSKKEHQPDPRLVWRRSHVGYYLIGEGADELRARAGVRLPSANASRISCAVIRMSFIWAALKLSPC